MRGDGAAIGDALFSLKKNALENASPARLASLVGVSQKTSAIERRRLADCFGMNESKPGVSEGVE